MPRLAKQEAHPDPSSRQDVEFVLNQLAADQAVLRLTLQSVLLRVLAARPDTAAVLLTELKEHVLRSAALIPVSQADVEGGERWKRLVHLRAEGLFAEIADAVEASLKSAPRQ